MTDESTASISPRAEVVSTRYLQFLCHFLKYRLIITQMLSYETQLEFKRNVVVKAYKNYSSMSLRRLPHRILRFCRSSAVQYPWNTAYHWFTVAIWLPYENRYRYFIYLGGVNWRYLYWDAYSHWHDSSSWKMYSICELYICHNVQLNHIQSNVSKASCTECRFHSPKFNLTKLLRTLWKFRASSGAGGS